MSRDPSHAARHAPPGFTLLELMVALALFSLVAVMSLQVLTGAVHQRRVLEQQTGDSAALMRLMALLRADLDSLVPLPFTPPLGGQEAAYAPSGNTLALSLGGQMRLAGDARREDGFQRVIWQFDAQAETLSRGIWPVLHPRDPGQRGPDIVLLEGVTSFEVTPPETSETLPRQIEVTFETRRHGPLRLVVSP